MDLVEVKELADDGTGTVLVPVIGYTLCAGFPSPADDFLEGALELPRWLVPNPPASFLWNVRGDSMRGAGIFDRDLALADRSMKPERNSVVVAVVNGEFSCKRLIIEGNRGHLAFDNPDLPAYALDELSDVEIWGVIRFSIRWHIVRSAHAR